ncbi:aldehyde dehydrogenase family protein [Paracoccus sp. MBLB3053]|uniref:Aldehyde dehydrogenase family protein n=1 Tax=Paracoccus aurantius TaxID=3073814 RepID=A0ABU2HYR3_9RHOB|nr:aldehyde dehydrogenase family protein [Paracoccus sp. MBLB3053]MDS9470176.1 aldehyde dehydrogenase family protein [Paracoccus sp. MBLB3053]
MLDHADQTVSSPIAIDGTSVEAATFEVTNPATGRVSGRAPRGTIAYLDAAVAAADRAAACEAIAAKLEEHTEKIAVLIAREQGKLLNGLGSRFQMGSAVARTRDTVTLSAPVEVLQNGDNGRVELYRCPLGVVGFITPWIWPVMIAIWDAAAATCARSSSGSRDRGIHRSCHRGPPTSFPTPIATPWKDPATIKGGISSLLGSVGHIGATDRRRTYVTHVSGVVGTSLSDAGIVEVMNFIRDAWAEDTTPSRKNKLRAAG